MPNISVPAAAIGLPSRRLFLAAWSAATILEPLKDAADTNIVFAKSDGALTDAHGLPFNSTPTRLAASPLRW